jgi:hypothetical protein
MTPGEPSSRTGADQSLDPVDLVNPTVLETTVAALSTSVESALVKAASEGLPDRVEVADWVERTKRLVLMQHERSALRSEVPHLAGRLLNLLREVNLPDGTTPAGIVETFLPRLPAIRSMLAEDVEAAPRAASRRSSWPIPRSAPSRSIASPTSCTSSGCRRCRG